MFASGCESRPSHNNPGSHLPGLSIKLMPVDFSTFLWRSAVWLCDVLQLEFLKEPSIFVQLFPGENCAHWVLPSSALSQRYQGAGSAENASAVKTERTAGTTGLVFILRPPYRDVKRTPVMQLSYFLSWLIYQVKRCRIRANRTLSRSILLVLRTILKTKQGNIYHEHFIPHFLGHSGSLGLVQNTVARLCRLACHTGGDSEAGNVNHAIRTL